MSNSGYDPFDYGLIKPDAGDEQVPAPQGDPEDMLFDSESGGTKAPAPGYDPGPMGSSPTGLEPSQTREDPEDLLFGEPASSSAPQQADSFTPAPPPAFEEPAPPRRKQKRPRQLSVGASQPVAAPPSPPVESTVPPPWLRDDKAGKRRIPVKTSEDKPVSRIALKVASPGVAHHRKSGGGTWLLPMTVLVIGLCGAGYCYWILEKVILAGLVCAISLIGSMFCGVLLRSKT